MVQMQPYQDSPTRQQAPDVWAIAQGNSTRGLSFETPKDQWNQSQSLPIGTNYIGRLKQNLAVKQARDFDSGTLKFYPDGNPEWMIEAVLDTNLRDPQDPEDDGVRKVFFQKQLKQALQQEMRVKNVQRFGVGTVIQITLVDLKNTGKGRPQKIYEVALSEIQPWTDDAPVQQALGNPDVAAFVQQALGNPDVAAFVQQAVAPQAQYPQAAQQQVQYQQPQVPQAQAPLQQVPQQQFPQQAPPVPQPAPVQQQIAQPAYQPQAPMPINVAPQPPLQAHPQAAVPAEVLANAGYTEVPQQHVVTQEHVDQVTMIMNAGLPRDAAVAAVAAKSAAGDATFAAALDASIPF